MIKKLLVYFDNFFYRKLVRNILKTSKLGYGFVVTGAESGVNYEHIYDNKPAGKYFVGKFVDQALLSLPAVRSTRGRKDDVKKILWNEISNNKFLGKKTRILDLASGGARYLREFSEEHRRGDVESICIDKNIESIKLGEELSRKEKLKNIKFFKANMFSLSHLKKFSAKLRWVPDVVVASGIFIYFNDEVVEGLLQEIYKQLPSGGLILFTSYEKIDSKKLMRKAMQTSSGEEWTLYYRKPEYWRAVLKKTGFNDAYILRDQWLMNNICFARK